VQRINPIPDSNFNVIGWTFEWHQNLRTAPIQGHYDIDNNDIATDEEGNVYLLSQIERWDFNFCTDCNDVFIDGWSMLFKFDPDGKLLDQERLNITTAVVSSLRFLSVSSEEVVVRIDDINNAGTAVETSIFIIDEDLEIDESFTLDKFYNHVATDEEQNIYAVTNVYDPNDPEIKGESDVQVVKFDDEGELLWKSYYGGSSFDYPRGFVLLPEGGLAFLANTESTDFDIEENHGYNDMWLVKLSENTTAVEETDPFSFSFYPNPTVDVVNILSPDLIQTIEVLDITGQKQMEKQASGNASTLHLEHLSTGSYFLRITDSAGRQVTKKIVRI
jgi:hypothetical protein